jgi:hypothetical protein
MLPAGDMAGIMGTVPPPPPLSPLPPPITIVDSVLPLQTPLNLANVTGDDGLVVVAPLTPRERPLPLPPKLMLKLPPPPKLPPKLSPLDEPRRPPPSLLLRLLRPLLVRLPRPPLPDKSSGTKPPERGLPLPSLPLLFSPSVTGSKLSSRIVVVAPNTVSCVISTTLDEEEKAEEDENAGDVGKLGDSGSMVSGDGGELGDTDLERRGGTIDRRLLLLLRLSPEDDLSPSPAPSGLGALRTRTPMLARGCLLGPCWLLHKSLPPVPIALSRGLGVFDPAPWFRGDLPLPCRGERTAPSGSVTMPPLASLGGGALRDTVACLGDVLGVVRRCRGDRFRLGFSAGGVGQCSTKFMV